MSTNFKNLFSLTALAGMFVVSSAMADVNAGNDHKAWTSFGRSGNVASNSYRSAAPMIVKSETAPAAVAQAPTTERAYSYEPAKAAAASSACGGNAAAAPAPSTTQKTTTRSFSYEPSYSSGRAVMGGRSSSSSGFSIDVGRRAKGY